MRSVLPATATILIATMLIACSNPKNAVVPTDLAQMASISDATKKLTPEEREVFQNLVNQLYDRFVKVVVSGRHGLNEARVREFADVDGFGLTYVSGSIKPRKTWARTADAFVASVRRAIEKAAAVDAEKTKR